MNTELYIARHLIQKQSHNFSRPIIRISILSVVLGLAVMLLSVSIVIGFKNEIREKVTGFAGHIQISKYDSNSSFETTPIVFGDSLKKTLEQIKGIKHLQSVATKAGIMQAKEDILGVVLKGINTDYDTTFFAKHLLEGHFPKLNTNQLSDEVLISKKIADQLQLALKDTVRVYFLNNSETTARGRRLFVSGIYETSLEEFDESFVFADQRHVQRLNNWTEDQVSNIEIFVDDFDRMEEITELVYSKLGYNLTASNAKEIYPQIFDWLALQDINVVVILVLMLLISSVSMISTLLVLILERTTTIGILKALGTQNVSIRKIFLYQAAYIIVRGLFWGNLLGIGLAVMQKYFGIIKLDQANYYMSEVPINLAPFPLIAVNVLSLIIILLFLLIPSIVVSKINPVSAIRYE
ncbi:MAG: FtsX-like permease family protein [Bacteroidales bacterium]|nr:FtsX-like permease family protein [Bacteroidales bacterium]